MRIIGVTGADTGVGKTFLSASLLLAAQTHGPACYWKPVQTGSAEDDDTTTVRSLTRLGASHFAEPVYRFKAPVSPHLAGSLEDQVIELDTIRDAFQRLSSGEGTLIIEGAGGLLVPLTPRHLQADLFREWDAEWILVSPNRLGAINHTLLSLEAMSARRMRIRGVILNGSRQVEGNAEAIRGFSTSPILAEIPHYSDPAMATQLAARQLGSLFS